jgi:hypothetical protein
MGSLPTINRWPFVAALLVVCAVPAWGQSAPWQPGEDLKTPFRAPEHRRASCQEVAEARRHVPTLSGPIFFPHLGLAVLEDIKEFELRPEDTPGEWAVPLRRWYEMRNDCPVPMAPPAWERMSEDERELRSSGLARRLIELAITGRITKREFDGLVRRLQGE